MNKEEIIQNLDKSIETISKLQTKIRKFIDKEQQKTEHRNLLIFLKKKELERKNIENRIEWDMNFIGVSVYDYINYANL
jgi:transposase